MKMKLYFIIVCLVAGVDGLSTRVGTPDGSEEWGYIPLRPGASMFYWFYKTTHPDGHLHRPLVLWLQGGPGLSGTGVGNFLMFGPLDHNLEPRNTTWIQTVNVLFVDSPVETGYSLVDNTSQIPDNIEAISNDLITMLKTFMAEHPYYKKNPFYIFGQSYGGKTTAALVYYLHKAIEKGEIECNLKGAGIGNGFVAGTDIMVNWAPMLYQMGVIDNVQYQNMSEISSKAWCAGEKEDWKVVRVAMDELLDFIATVNPSLNLYNILDLDKVEDKNNDTDSGSSKSRRKRSLRMDLGSVYQINISDFMNGPVREKLGVIPKDKVWNEGKQRTQDVQYETFDIFKPVWNLVNEVLNSSDIDIVVYSGQLDLICNTAGALQWMSRLTWDGMKGFDEAERKTLVNPETRIPEMFVKSYQNLKMYWVLNSGHVVPSDAPDAALRMLNRILDDLD